MKRTKLLCPCCCVCAVLQVRELKKRQQKIKERERQIRDKALQREQQEKEARMRLLLEQEQFEMRVAALAPKVSKENRTHTGQRNGTDTLPARTCVHTCTQSICGAHTCKRFVTQCMQTNHQGS